MITGRNRRDVAPVLKKYERVCFTKEAVHLIDKPNAPFAAMVAPRPSANVSHQRCIIGASRQFATARYSARRSH